MFPFFLAWMLGNAAIAIMFYMALRRGSVALAMVGAFLAIQMQVRPLIFILGLDGPFPAEQFSSGYSDLATKASLLGVVWTTLLLIFHGLFRQTQIGLAMILPPPPKNPDQRFVIFASLVATVIAVIATVAVVIDYGSIARFSYAVKVGKELAGLYVLREFATIASLLAIYGLLINAQETYARNGEVRRTLPWGILILTGIQLLINFMLIFLWGNRINIGILMIVLAISIHLHIRKFRLIELLAYGGIAVTALAGLRDVRWLLFSEAVNKRIDPGFSFWTDVSTSLHFAQFDALMLALRDAGTRFDFRLGEDFINGLLSWIPRWLYPEKEGYHVGQWFRQMYEPTRVNGWPVTTAGDWYVNFSWPGILLGALVSGYCTAAIDKYYNDPRGNAWHVVVGGGIAGFALSGGFWTGTVQAGFFLIVPFWIICYVMRRFPAKPAFRRQPAAFPAVR